MQKPGSAPRTRMAPALSLIHISCDMPDIDTIDGENVKGEEFMEFYPDEEELRQYVMDHFYTKENPTTEQ